MLRLALNRPDIDPTKIQLRQKIVDSAGKIGPGGRTYEYDVLAEDGRLTVFEVKSVSEEGDVDRLADKVELIRSVHPGKAVEGVLVTLVPEDAVQERCRATGILLVS